MSNKVSTFSVPANVPWTVTNLKLDDDDKVTIQVLSGTWTANPALSQVGGDGHLFFVAKPGYTLPGYFEGVLVGYVGKSAPPNDASVAGVFAIGQNLKLSDRLKGYLFLGINDDIERRYGVGHTDNLGALSVQVSINS
ncbi:MAG TPA: hypothetical protein VIG99_27860 [Myxococcaceae bacterium]|jgi:hypothetical protein